MPHSPYTWIQSPSRTAHLLSAPITGVHVITNMCGTTSKNFLYVYGACTETSFRIAIGLLPRTNCIAALNRQQSSDSHHWSSKFSSDTFIRSVSRGSQIQAPAHFFFFYLEYLFSCLGLGNRDLSWPSWTHANCLIFKDAIHRISLKLNKVFQ